jgi:hypothetical protein
LEQARRRSAQYCDPESKRMMLRIAEDYLRMAEHAERRAKAQTPP